MSRYAIGDIQGCYEELRALLARVRFSPDRDRLWLVGDLVNRGPQSLEVLRYVRSLGDSAIVVLGNHDLHLLAVIHGSRRKRRSDTLDDILNASDRDKLLEWLATRPLAHRDPERGELMVHAGVVPQWTTERTLELAQEVETALRRDPARLFEQMYGDEPSRWRDDLTGADRLRFTINTLTRLRVCTADGKVDLKVKGKPQAASSGSPYRAWFDHEGRRTAGTRMVFGHWSALGFVQRHNIVGLDSGCVWGGALTALDLDSDRAPVSVACNGYQIPDE
ncbi:MAG TPA: symmetrical bis(5'-nucleosyl)-tetraphosphatase [Steroidobacteraceae bacterium]|nr:symmetrical bis(5'-nucleosyl)-tetraphosphatase [Steroidobacteraceae bacterium]